MQQSNVSFEHRGKSAALRSFWSTTSSEQIAAGICGWPKSAHLNVDGVRPFGCFALLQSRSTFAAAAAAYKCKFIYGCWRASQKEILKRFTVMHVAGFYSFTNANKAGTCTRSMEMCYSWILKYHVPSTLNREIRSVPHPTRQLIIVPGPDGITACKACEPRVPGGTRDASVTCKH